MQWRIEQPHRDRQAVHRVEDLGEVVLLDLAQLVERGRLLLVRRGEDHAAHDGEAVGGEEHVLGAAQPDALGAEAAGVGRVLPGVGVGAHTELAAAHGVGPRQDGVELGGRFGRRERHRTEHHVAGRAVERDDVALVDGHVAGGEGTAGDLDRLRTDDGRGTPAPGDDGGVADEPAASGEDALRGHHPVDVLRARLVAHEDHLVATLGGRLGVVGGEVDLADGGAR